MTSTRVQQTLESALRANKPGSGTPHVVIALPSYNLAESLLAHYMARVPSLEHRYLLALPLLARMPHCELVLVCSRGPEPEVVDYYVSLLPAHTRSSVRDRFHVIDVDDPSVRGVAAKLLDRPDLVERIRRIIADRAAVIEPWNVTQAEVALAAALGTPVDGTPPHLWHLGFKSEGRRVLRSADVPVAEGVEDVRTVDGVLEAIEVIRARRPDCPGAVVKTDDSASGDGNRVLRFGGEQVDLRGALEALPAWYLHDLAQGGVVEELVAGAPFSSPSVQVDMLPDGRAWVLATHEQVLGGEDDQVYQGCRFPADDEYAAQLGAYGRAAGERLRALGALGRISVDFAVGREPDGRPRACALEINLRKGGTTHTYAALRNLVPGHYDVDAARWVVEADGSHRFYEATDNLLDPAWIGRVPSEVIGAVRAAGLEFDHDAGTGVVLHMLSCLAVDGRMGFTAFGSTRQQAADLFAATERALGE